MLKLIFWFIVLAAVAAGLTWLAEHPGEMSINWLGYEIESMPVAFALGVLAAGLLVLWLVVRIIRMIFAAPGAAVDFFRLRRRKKGLDELSGGLVALLAGDAASARKSAHKAARLIPSEPVARLLEARAAQELGDTRTARALMQKMLEDERTEPAALLGLFEQARKEGDEAAARALARRAWDKYPTLPWAAKAMLAFTAADHDWPAVTRLLEAQRASGLLDKQEANRLKAVAFTAQALDLEETDPQQAMDLAVRAHKLDPSLVPAATIAGGMLAARGYTRKAAKIIEKTWRLSPHPDLAEIYAHLRSGDSPRDRMKRLQALLAKASGGEEGAVALARAAIEAQDWETARGALRPWLDDNPTARVFELMAEIEQGQHGDKGRAREWLARAVRAKRNPAWTADGMVSPKWLPLSPVSGELGVFEWKTPLQGSEQALAGSPIPAELLEALPRDETPEAEMKMVGGQSADEAPRADEQADEKPATKAGDTVVELKAEKAPAGSEDEKTATPAKQEQAEQEQKAETGKQTESSEAPKDSATPGPEKNAPPANGGSNGNDGVVRIAKKKKPTGASIPPPAPGMAPPAPPMKSRPKVVERENDVIPPIPDDPGPKERDEKSKSNGWVG